MALNKQDYPDFVFLLFGPQRSGKSSTGNFMLKKKAFSENETTKCVAVQETIAEQTIQVIDTIPTTDYSEDPQRILHDNRQITRSLLLSASGPRNIIVVFQIDQNPKQIAGCIQFLQIMLGNDAMKDISIIFTGTSNVSGAAFTRFLNALNPSYPEVKKIIAACKERCLALNDGDSRENNQRKVAEFMEAAKKTNRGSKEIQLVMIGESQGGKSKAANSILGEEVFMSGSETRGCTVASRSVNGKGVLVVDTPGLSSKVMGNDAILAELNDPAISLSAPSRTLALVMRMDREQIIDGKKNPITIIEDRFSDKIARRLVIIFTRQDEYLKRENSSFGGFLRDSPPQLKDLLKRCHYRCKGFNNMAMMNNKDDDDDNEEDDGDDDDDENQRQVKVILQFVDQSDSNLRLVLIGNTGTGKSSTGNTILKRPNVFERSSSTVSITSKCKRAEARTVGGRVVEIIDTPGLFDTRPENTTTVTLIEMARCLTMTVPGPHAFLLVIAISEKFTKEQQACIEIIRKIFGEELFRHTLVIFTCVDRLDPDKTPDEAIRASGKCIKEVLEKNDNRWLAFNNRQPTGNELEKVMQEVELMLACNDGRHYSSAIYRRIATRLEAYGAGTFAEMRAFADNQPWIMLAIVAVLVSSPAFGFGYVVAGSTLGIASLTIAYERFMGRNTVETEID